MYKIRNIVQHSVVKMCAMKTHTLPNWVTENFARIFVLGAISKEKNLVRVTSTKIH